MPENSTPVSTPTNEEWRPVVGYEGWYAVSNLGRVMRVMPACGTRAGTIRKQTPNTAGYPTVKLSREGRTKTFVVYELVACAFLGPRPEGREINHIDGVKTNTLLSNLEYVTPSGNRQHAVDMGLLSVPYERRARGERQHSSKLSAEQVIEIRRLLAEGETASALARRFGVARNNIRLIGLRKIWTHI